MKMKNEGVTAELRRDFLTTICVAFGGLAGAIMTFPVIGFFLAPLLRKLPSEWRAVGPIDNFPVGQMVLVSYVDPSPLPWSGTTATSAAYVHRVTETAWEAFSIHCTHLGCPVRWLPDAKLFMCPCHGGVYYANGSVAAGPPPRHLVHIDLRQRAGEVELRTIPIPIT
jgi:quinol---cytochrome c reductase iron-sulfur subunit, bacillus type